MSPALAGGFFTTSTTSEAPMSVMLHRLTLLIFINLLNFLYTNVFLSIKNSAWYKNAKSVFVESNSFKSQIYQLE